ncbi:MAG: LysE family translocator [Candidatus Solibacter usitatus]|nr:LysE family translocator [Candidatus Solibacter usitatus]
MDPRYWAFLGLAAVLTLTPGADTALVMRSTLGRGRNAAVLTVCGICLGCLVHSIASALGLSIILRQSAAAFETMKIAGAAYLAWLGAKSLWAVWKGELGAALPLDARQIDGGRWASFSEGLFTNLLNPKVALFYLTLLPQFVIPEGNALLQSVTLASVHIVMGFLWLSAVAYFLDRTTAWVTRRPVRLSLEAITGMLLIGLGIRLALARR